MLLLPDLISFIIIIALTMGDNAQDESYHALLNKLGDILLVWDR